MLRGKLFLIFISGEENSLSSSLLRRIFAKINQSKIVVYIFTSICEDTRISCGYLIFKSLAICLKQDDSKSSLSDENPLDSYQPVRPVERELDTSWKLGVCSLKVNESLNLLIRSQKSEGIVLWTSVCFRNKILVSWSNFIFSTSQNLIEYRLGVSLQWSMNRDDISLYSP